MLFHIKLSDTFFEFYIVSYNEEEVLHVLCQMPRAQHCVHVCAPPVLHGGAFDMRLGRPSAAVGNPTACSA